MAPLQDALEVARLDARVDLRRRERGVTEEDLNPPYVGASFQEVRREGMAERVRRDLLRKAAPLHRPLDEVAHVVRPHRRSEACGEERLSGFRRCELEVALERFESLLADRK